MVAYFISDADIEDATGYKEYTTKVPVLIAKYGGEYLVRGGMPFRDAHHISGRAVVLAEQNTVGLDALSLAECPVD